MRVCVCMCVYIRSETPTKSHCLPTATLGDIPNGGSKSK